MDRYLIELFNHLESEVGESIDYVLVSESNTARKIRSERLINPKNNQIILLDQSNFFRKATDIIRDNDKAIHIFLSFWGEKKLFPVILFALLQKRNVMVVLEPYSESPHGYWEDEARIVSHIKVFLRKLAYPFSNILFRIISGGKLPCILAVSEIVEDQLKKANYKEETIFPFGYFIDKKNVAKRNIVEDKNLRLMFSGSLIKRKGLDIVLEALVEINKTETKVTLDIYGPGEIKEYFKEDLRGVRYQGTYKPGSAQQVMSQYDMLIVPSRHDGWGLVVNEALLQSVPIIVSDRVGAKVLVEYSGAGRVFESENVRDLKEILLEIFDDPENLNLMRKNCEKVHDFISPDYGSSYLKKIIDYYFYDEGDRPKIVWKNKSL